MGVVKVEIKLHEMFFHQLSEEVKQLFYSTEPCIQGLNGELTWVMTEERWRRILGRINKEALIRARQVLVAQAVINASPSTTIKADPSKVWTTEEETDAQKVTGS